MKPVSPQRELHKLLKTYIRGKASKQETEFLEKHYAFFEKDPSHISKLSEEDKKRLGEELLAGIREKIRSGRLIRMSGHTWLRAAAILILVAGACLLWLMRGNEDQKIQESAEIARPKEILPGGDKALLTLADGTTIILDTAANGALSMQGSAQVVKKNGELEYFSDGVPAEPVYNTVSTPRGGQFHLVLADGSRVWLNSASSLRFPTSFPGNERLVELTGEGYFEVATRSAQPFRVRINGRASVEAIGTHFNINAYEEESGLLTTLLEGRVRVASDSVENVIMLQPGQQAQQKRNGQLSLNPAPDFEEVMAWKNGRFVFGESMDMQTVMRQIARWYDVDVTFQDQVSGHIGGSISRNVNASQVFQMLEKTGAVSFRIEGKKVTVLAGSKK